jgi:hypothetical protein
MANVNPTGYFTDFELQRQQLDRQQAIADALRKESMEPIKTNEVAGGYVVPVSPLQNLAKLAQVLAGNYKQSKLDEQGKEIARQQNEYLGKQADELATAITPRKGMPAQKFTTGDPTGMGPVADVPATPDYNPGQAEMNTALARYLTNIGQPTKAADYVIQDAKQRMFMNALTGGGGAPTDATAQNSTQAAPGMIGQPSAAATQAAPVSAYKLLSPEDQNIVQSYIMAGKPEKAVEHMGEVLKPKMSSDGKTFIARNGQTVVMPGSISAFNSFQQAANANTPLDPKFTDSQGRPLGGSVAGYLGQSTQASGQQPAEAFQGEALLNQLPPALKQKMLEDAKKSGETEMNVNYQLPNGKVVKGAINLASSATGAPNAAQPTGVGQSTIDKQFQENLGSGMAKTLVEGQTKSEEMRDQIRALDKSMDLIKSGAILGAGADLKVDAAKILNSTFNTNISPDKVANTDFLRSTLGMPILTKAKALGYNPTDADAKRLDVILGTISKDPSALPKLLEFNREMAIKGIEAHNVKAANVKAPYSLSVDVPGAYQFNPQSSPNAASPGGSRIKTYNPATGKVE